MSWKVRASSGPQTARPWTLDLSASGSWSGARNPVEVCGQHRATGVGLYRPTPPCGKGHKHPPASRPVGSVAAAGRVREPAGLSRSGEVAVLPALTGPVGEPGEGLLKALARRDAGLPAE